MELTVYYDPRCLSHQNGPGHPERPQRLAAIRARIEQTDYGCPVQFVSPEPAAEHDLLRVHTAEYLEELERSSRRPHTVFDPDTAANEHSFLAARLAAGGALAAVRSVLAGDPVLPFVAMRPPGHHAEPDRAMGFCLLNSVAVAAADAVAAGLERVAIVDWDVHHGNGTERTFADRGEVLYVSLHQSPHYPGTGRSSDVGRGAGAGRTVNLPLPAGSGHREYAHAFEEVALPVLAQYRPELVIVSAGFDVDERDPLAGTLLGPSSISWITARLREIAQSSAEGRIVHVLEGGYDMAGLADGADAVLSVLAGRPVQPTAADGEATAADGEATAADGEATAADGEPTAADGERRLIPVAAAAVEQTRRALAPYWKLGAGAAKE